MKNAFKLNGDIEITMTPQSQNWKQVMELVKDGDVFTVTKANNTSDVVFKRTGQVVSKIPTALEWKPKEEPREG